MENYIDWNDAAKGQGDLQQKPQASANTQESSSAWQGAVDGPATTTSQNPYDVVTHSKDQSSTYVNTNYGQPYRNPYENGSSMSPSLSPGHEVATQPYTYAQMAPQRSQSQQGFHNPSGGQSIPAQNPTANYGVQYNHPYTYANGGNPYNQVYPQSNNPQATYISSYNPQSYQTATSVSNGRYPSQGHAYSAQSGSSIQQQQQHQHQQQQQYQYQYSQPPQGYPQQFQYAQQYQRPEDALYRVQQSYPVPRAGISGNAQARPRQPLYSTWQSGPGEPVYFGMDARPIAPQKAAIPATISPVRPSSPPRPNEPLAALRYDVSHCLNDYNTSRDIKGCVAALLAIMTTCDPVVPAAKDGATGEPKETPKVTKELDTKIKQTALLSVVHSEMKGAMIEEVCKNKSIRAKLRTWFVRAHKDNSFIVLKSLILVLNKLAALSATSLAEVKFGKAIIIVSRKCEDKEIKDLLAPWIPKAEESLVVERQIDAAVEEDEKKKAAAKPSAASNGTSKSQTKSPPIAVDARAKKLEGKGKDGPIQRKPETVAKTNAAFFKKEALPIVKPVLAKPGMAAALASMKARKKSDSEKAVAETETKSANAPASVQGASKSTVNKNASSGKSTFSALKLVEGLKRTVSPNVSKDMEPVPKKQRQKKSVSWRPDLELEQIKIFESVEPEGGWESVHTPHQYGNARDLDRREGAILHQGILPDREEDFIDWHSPRDLDFRDEKLASGSDTRGPKTAGTKAIYSKASQAEEARESTVFLVAYASEQEIPWSPSETLAVHDLEVQAPAMPKTIPLPAELSSDWRIKQVLGNLAGPDGTSIQQIQSVSVATALPPSLPLPTPGQAGATPDIAAILAGILAAQQNATAAPTASNIVQGQNPMTSTAVPIEVNTAATAALPVPPPPMLVDANLADFLRMAAVAGNNSNGNLTDTPPFPLPPMPSLPAFSDNNQATGHTTSSTSTSYPLPPQFGGARDVRPWVKYNENGRYRDPCRFVLLGKCDKGDACGYLHLDGPAHR